MTIGPNPRYLEELRIGGGYGDAQDGGVDLEKNGNIATDGGLTLKGILSAGATPQALTNAAGEIDGGRIQDATIDSAQLASNLDLDGDVSMDDLTVNNDLDVDGDSRFDGKVILGAAPTLTIASGAVTVTKAYHTVAGEGAAADDLDTIDGGEVGQLLILRTATGDHAITVKAGTGNIVSGGDFFMNSVTDVLVLLRAGSNWFEVTRSNNG